MPKLPLPGVRMPGLSEPITVSSSGNPVPNVQFRGSPDISVHPPIHDLPETCGFSNGSEKSAPSDQVNI
jgi:hypothetical protein